MGNMSFSHSLPPASGRGGGQPLPRFTDQGAERWSGMQVQLGRPQARARRSAPSHVWVLGLGQTGSDSVRQGPNVPAPRSGL